MALENWDTRVEPYKCTELKEFLQIKELELDYSRDKNGTAQTRWENEFRKTQQLHEHKIETQQKIYMPLIKLLIWGIVASIAISNGVTEFLKILPNIMTALG